MRRSGAEEAVGHESIRVGYLTFHGLSTFHVRGLRLGEHTGLADEEAQVGVEALLEEVEVHKGLGYCWLGRLHLPGTDRLASRCEKGKVRRRPLQYILVK